MDTVPRKRLRKYYKLTPHVDNDDPFSRLTDDIIGHHILSRLPLKEATRTSVLACRWQKLWTYNICPKLEFSYSHDNIFDPLFIWKRKVLDLRRLLFCGINKTIEAYSKPKVEELAIRFDFERSASQSIDKWVEFAFRKGVKRLELDFSCWQWSCLSETRYTFPSKEKLSGLHVLCGYHLHQPVNCAGMYNLRNVCLKYVNVSSEVIELMLTDCPFLEHMCVWKSKLLREVKVTEKSSKLKSLEFVTYVRLKLEISSSSLVSLKYVANGTPRLEHAPLLSELSIGGAYCRSFLSSGAQDFGYISQLSKLTLDIPLEAVRESTQYPQVFPELMKLELLEVIMTTYDNSCLLWPLILTKAAPFLRRFCVEVRPLGEKGYKELQLEGNISNLRHTAAQVNHQCLKVVEMRSFMGYPKELELGQYLLGISQTLKQFVVAPRRRGSRTTPHPRDERCASIRRYRELAKGLSNWLPSGANFVVL